MVALHYQGMMAFWGWLLKHRGASPTGSGCKEAPSLGSVWQTAWFPKENCQRLCLGVETISALKKCVLQLSWGEW